MGDARSNTFLTYSTSAMSSTGSNDDKSRKASYSTTEQSTEAEPTDRHQMQLDADSSSVSSREAGGGILSTSAAAIARRKSEGSPGGPMSSREDGQYIMRSPTEHRREQQHDRNGESLHNSDDDFDPYNEVRINQELLRHADTNQATNCCPKRQHCRSMHLSKSPLLATNIFGNKLLPKTATKLPSKLPFLVTIIYLLPFSATKLPFSATIILFVAVFGNFVAWCGQAFIHLFHS